MPDLSKQTQIHPDANGPIPGDCWRTALACLLEVPAEEVPHFVHLYPKSDDPEEDLRWWSESRLFVERLRPDYELRVYDPTFPFWTLDLIPEGANPNVILVGKSPRGDWLHAVIVSASTGELVHDPHPSGDGVHSQVEVVTIIPKEYVRV